MTHLTNNLTKQKTIGEIKLLEFTQVSQSKHIEVIESKNFGVMVFQCDKGNSLEHPYFTEPASSHCLTLNPEAVIDNLQITGSLKFTGYDVELIDA